MKKQVVAELLCRVLTASVIVTAIAAGQEGVDASRMVPAFYSSIRPAIIAFPPGKSAVEIPLPFSLGGIVYSRDGREIFAGDNDLPKTGPPRMRRGVFRIDLESGRASIIPGSEGSDYLGPFAAQAVTTDAIIVSGRRVRSGAWECGLFSIGLADGAVRSIAISSDCNYAAQWQRVSASPDGTRALAVRRSNLELIDLGSGAIRPITSGIYKAEWSPDGVWIAALENGGHNKTILMNSATFAREKILPSSEAVWSPDSRSLLVVTSGGLRCNSYFGTLATMDIGSARVTPIPSSVCRVNQPTTGWIVLPKAR